MIERLGEAIDAVMDSEWVGRILILLALLGLVVLGIAIATALYTGWQANSNCVRWERKIVHQSAYTYYTWVGKVMVPVYQPARDVEMNVCVQPKEQRWP